MTDQKPTDLVDRLRHACNGHPYAKIEWPHRVLHEAADEIELLRKRLDEAAKLPQPGLDRATVFAAIVNAADSRMHSHDIAREACDALFASPPPAAVDVSEGDGIEFWPTEPGYWMPDPPRKGVARTPDLWIATEILGEIGVRSPESLRYYFENKKPVSRIRGWRRAFAKANDNLTPANPEAARLGMAYKAAVEAGDVLRERVRELEGIRTSHVEILAKQNQQILGTRRDLAAAQARVRELEDTVRQVYGDANCGDDVSLTHTKLREALPKYFPFLAAPSPAEEAKPRAFTDLAGRAGE